MAEHIPWSVAIPPEVYTEYCGVKMGDYHADPGLQMHVQLHGPEILHEKYGLPLRRGVSPDFTSYLDTSLFGLEVDFSDDNIPSPKGHPIKSIEEAAALTVPDDLSKAGLYPAALEFYAHMKAHAPEDVSVGFGGGGEAPFTNAILLRGQDFLLDVYDHPDLAHRFLATLTEANIRQREFARELTAQSGPMESIGYCDDFGGLLLPDQYREFNLPCLLSIADHFGAKRKTIHTELLRQAHLTILQDHGWVFIDVGTDPYLTVADCREVLEIPFLVQFKSSQDMLLSNPAQIREKYREMVEEGAGRMLVELCRGVPEENVRAFIEVAKEYE